MLQAAHNDTGKVTCETCPVALLYLNDHDGLFPSIWTLRRRKEGESEFSMSRNCSTELCRILIISFSSSLILPT